MPWNHPLLITVKKLAPALAAGNTVVIKPSELAPCTIIELVEMLTKEAGVPNGVINVDCNIESTVNGVMFGTFIAAG